MKISMGFTNYGVSHELDRLAYGESRALVETLMAEIEGYGCCGSNR